ncbi:hypothetical protein [Yersinia massiliensis]|uniref:hypothetical protein n=1 Tax=Yersinia massiliensis TaxID=419257 RepID=UPI0003177415|nr:hypothetical protein [Yersinia massiliensis]
MSEKTEFDVQQTAQEKVLIKHQVMKASRFKKMLTEQARKKTAETCQLAQQEANEIHRVAYQEGYQHGLQKLLADLLQGLESSQNQYQQMLLRSEAKLQTLLADIFGDMRVYEIVSEHFIQLHPESSPIQIYLPPALLQKLKPALAQKQHITALASEKTSIALEIDNEILHFSPESAVQSTQPHIFTPSVRCTILQSKKDMYRNLSEQLSQSGALNDNNDASLCIENSSSPKLEA